ncbi:hypothetical protein CRUP_017454 [Coryphaenoides rupestris]|nr:hypothetical protein CRUP_017454 [Coryphaenoides rupestris]
MREGREWYISYTISYTCHNTTISSTLRYCISSTSSLVVSALRTLLLPTFTSCCPFTSCCSWHKKVGLRHQRVGEAVLQLERPQLPLDLGVSSEDWVVLYMFALAEEVLVDLSPPNSQMSESSVMVPWVRSQRSRQAHWASASDGATRYMRPVMLAAVRSCWSFCWVVIILDMWGVGAEDEACSSPSSSSETVVHRGRGLSALSLRAPDRGPPDQGRAADWLSGAFAIFGMPGAQRTLTTVQMFPLQETGQLWSVSVEHKDRANAEVEQLADAVEESEEMSVVDSTAITFSPPLHRLVQPDADVVKETVAMSPPAEKLVVKSTAPLHPGVLHLGQVPRAACTQYQFERASREKNQLVLENEALAAALRSTAEQLERMNIQGDVWRTKFLASRVMADELTNSRAALQQKLVVKSTAPLHPGVLHLGQVPRAACTQVAAVRILVPRAAISHSGRVNRELKRLLVASVGDDLQYQFERASREKNQLVLENEALAAALRSTAEQLERMNIQGDVWRTKFLASRVMADELTNSRAALQQAPSHDSALPFLANQKKHRELLKTPVSRPDSQSEPSFSDSAPPFLANQKSIGRFHPYTRYENITFNCCERCSGDLMVL